MGIFFGAAFFFVAMKSPLFLFKFGYDFSRRAFLLDRGVLGFGSVSISDPTGGSDAAIFVIAGINTVLLKSWTYSSKEENPLSVLSPPFTSPPLCSPPFIASPSPASTWGHK
jgi:hypothetical protein